MKKYIVLLGLIFINIDLSAHRGGHYHTHDLNQLHHWDAMEANHRIIGNFSKIEGENVVIEGVHGKKYKLSMSVLSDNDKKYVESKIQKVKEFNYSIAFVSKIPIKTTLFSDKLIHFFLIFFGIFSVVLFLFWLLRSHISFAYSSVSLCILFLVIFLYACGKDNTSNSTVTTNDVAFLASIFEPFKSSGVSTRYDGTYFYVESSGIPSHNMMVGITSWQQQVPVPQPYIGTNAWSIPLKPELATNPLSLKINLLKGAVAIAANGIPIFNPLNNRGEDAYLFGELDNWGGHCGKADDYHYHIAPLHLQSTMGNKPIAVALDGYMIYGSTEPDGSIMKSLDTLNGHVYNGSYHYHGTSTYPYVMGAMRGKVSIDPNSTAPENQITPQALTNAFRPAGTPLKGATITSFSQTGTSAYLLQYKINNKIGSVAYSWNSSGKYTFIFTDTAGIVTNASYQR